MQNKKLKKAEKVDVQFLSELLKNSDYSYENMSINSFSLDIIKSFVENNLSSFTLYTINDSIKGFSIAFSGKNPVNKKDFFEKEKGIFEKIKNIFVKKIEYTLKNDYFYIDYIYFSNDIQKNNQLFLKYLEMEKLKNNCTKTIVNEKKF